MDSTVSLNMDSIAYTFNLFYSSIIYSLTEKTRLSFISSNSSFSECVRKVSSFYKSHTNALPDCSSDTFARETPCQRTQVPVVYSTGTNIFKYVEFASCSSSTHGGAIKCTGGTLEVLSSSFSLCSVSGYNGGAIYASSLSLFSIQNSVFSSCGGNYEADSGGAITLNVITSPTVCESLFYKCKSNENSGAIDMRNCGSNQKDIPIQCYLFIHCECMNGVWPSAGVLEASGNNCVYFSSTLFSSCKSYDGGALFLGYPFYSNYICFSFFTGNTATSTHGMEVFLRNNNALINIFFHSFSTTSSNQIYDEVTGQHIINLFPWVILAYATWTT